MTREAREILIAARVCELKRLAAETSAACTPSNAELLARRLAAVFADQLKKLNLTLVRRSN